jgi:hypothetical protein
MKSKLFMMLMAAAIATASCSTKDDAKPSTANVKFSVNGTAYTQAAAADSATTKVIAGKSFNVFAATGYSADKTAQAAIQLFFSGSAKPSAGSYKVVGELAGLTTGQVALLVIDKVNVAKQGLYGSTGKDNVSVTISLSSSGKLTATLPTVALTGSNFDNTDPKNTVVTTVSTTASGSMAEN